GLAADVPPLEQLADAAAAGAIQRLAGRGEGVVGERADDDAVRLGGGGVVAVQFEFECHETDSGGKWEECPTPNATHASENRQAKRQRRRAAPRGRGDGRTRRGIVVTWHSAAGRVRTRPRV